MKKIIFCIAIFFVAYGAMCQSCNLDTVNAGLTLRLRDWKAIAALHGPGTDSISRTRIRAVRNQIIAQSPANDDANVTIPNVPGEIIIFIYRSYVFRNTFGFYWNMGTNHTLRLTIPTQIKALTNACIVSHVALADTQAENDYNILLKSGKSIIQDN